MNVFERIVCGVDGTPAAIEGARQAAALAEERSQLLLVTVAMDASIAAVTAAGTGMLVPPPVLEVDEESLEPAARLVREEFPELKLETKVLRGPILPTILQALEDLRATLAVAGRHGHSRLAGLVLGSVATTLLHDAPCSVLVAGRYDGEPGAFPRSVVVGFDGSEQAEEAVRVAAELARRKDASLQAVCATGGQELDVDSLQARLTEVAPGLSLIVAEGKPADVLASRACDLVVLGNRGLHGLKALGSVSERVAHHADCSVLVVRSQL